MRKTIIKSALITAGALWGLSAYAGPAPHGPASGDCSGHAPGVSNEWDCVEWTDTSNQWWHATNSDWVGPSGDDTTTFVFSGPSDLGCGIITADCTLTLNGQVRIDSPGEMGIKVLSGNVTGGGLCDSIDLGQFPWYAGSTSDHTFNSSSYIPPQTTISYRAGYAEGNLGNIDLGLPIIPDIDDGHVHDIRFVNDGTNPSYFAFDSVIFTGGSADNNSGCSVVGNLEVTNVSDINAH